jgi:hypothetical protein
VARRVASWRRSPDVSPWLRCEAIVTARGPREGVALPLAGVSVGQVVIVCVGRARGPERLSACACVRRSRALLSTPGMGDCLGGESPLGEEVVLTPSRRQGRHREVGSEGSPRRNSAPRNTNRVEGGAIWVSLLKKVKPVITDRVVA